MSPLSLDLTLNVIVVYLPIPKIYGCYQVFGIFMFIYNVTFGLKSGWCNKHGNIKENETMPIEIISSQKKAFFLFSTGRPPISQSWCIVSIHERGKKKY